MRHLFFLSVITILIAAACSPARKSATAGLPPYVPANKALHDTIARLDSIFFDAYNTCKLDVFASYVAEDMEFYHDRNGLLADKKALVQSIQKYICNKVTRELLPGSLEVSPLGDYGAVEIGVHRFHNNQEGDKGTSRYSRFIQIWHREAGQWKLTRFISLH